MMGGDNVNPARDDNSYFSTNLNGTPTKINFSAKKTSGWNPNTSNYGYRLLDAYNTSGTDTKAFCTKYAGYLVPKVLLNISQIVILTVGQRQNVVDLN